MTKAVVSCATERHGLSDAPDAWAAQRRGASSTLTGARPASDGPRDHYGVSTTTLHRDSGYLRSWQKAVAERAWSEPTVFRWFVHHSPVAIRIGLSCMLCHG